jgi:hypothetical protein
MESAEAKTGEPPVADVEKQQPLLLPPRAAAAAETKAPPSGDACDCDRETFPRASPTAARTLAFVVLVAGAAFASQLAAREEYVLLAVFASQLGSFCLFTSLLALCARAPREVGGRCGRAGAAVVCRHGGPHEHGVLGGPDRAGRRRGRAAGARPGRRPCLPRRARARPVARAGASLTPRASSESCQILP